MTLPVALDPVVLPAAMDTMTISSTTAVPVVTPSTMTTVPFDVWVIYEHDGMVDVAE